MTEQRNALADLIAACWKDEALKARFLADPKAVLAEHGIEAPAHIDVKVVENSDDTVHITLPHAPQQDDLSDQDLLPVVAGYMAPTHHTYCLPIDAQAKDPAFH